MVLLDWLSHHPTKQKYILIFQVINMMPCFDMGPSNDPLRDFSDWMHSQSTNERKSHGAALALKSIIEFLLRDMITETHDYFQKIKSIERLIDDLRDTYDLDAEMFSLSEQRKCFLIFRNSVYQICESWVKLCHVHFPSTSVAHELLQREHLL
jgi:hypothetical protein